MAHCILSKLMSSSDVCSDINIYHTCIKTSIFIPNQIKADCFPNNSHKGHIFDEICTHTVECTQKAHQLKHTMNVVIVL